MPIPSEMPYLKLKAPSGKDWKFNSSNNENIIEGKAEDFCKVVTQVRNIDDLKLKGEGKVAKKWMEIAQCFAGKAEKPPISGSRKIRK